MAKKSTSKQKSRTQPITIAPQRVKRTKRTPRPDSKEQQEQLHDEPQEETDGEQPQQPDDEQQQHLDDEQQQQLEDAQQQMQPQTPEPSTEENFLLDTNAKMLRGCVSLRNPATGKKTRNNLKTVMDKAHAHFLEMGVTKRSKPSFKTHYTQTLLKKYRDAHVFANQSGEGALPPSDEEETGKEKLENRLEEILPRYREFEELKRTTSRQPQKVDTDSDREEDGDESELTGDGSDDDGMDDPESNVVPNASEQNEGLSAIRESVKVSTKDSDKTVNDYLKKVNERNAKKDIFQSRLDILLKLAEINKMSSDEVKEKTNEIQEDVYLIAGTLFD